MPTWAAAELPLLIWIGNHAGSRWLVPGLAAAAIIVCEGEHGWDDYLLLHHFDPAEPLDTMRE